MLCANAVVGVVETVAVATVSLTAVGMAGRLLENGIKALWSISGNLASSQAAVERTLESHAQRLEDHDNRLRVGGL